jgi:diguanylate cyclase (GGDEF)-like protein/PAS domain S-box-containing protein
VTIGWGDLFDSLSDGVYIVDTGRRILSWNKAAERITGFTRDEVLGRGCHENILLHVDERGGSLCQDGCQLLQVSQDGRPREAELYLRHRHGHRIPVSLRVVAMRNQAGALVGVAEVFTDLRPRAVMSGKMQEMQEHGFIDSLTHLANSRYVETYVGIALREVQDHQLSVGLLCMHIDHLEGWNEKYGHASGDRLIRLIANTVSGNTRPFDIIGRWGGTKLVAIIRHARENFLYNVAEKYRMLIARSSLTLDGRVLHPTASIGATMLRSADTAESALRRADVQATESRRAGANRVTIDMKLTATNLP